MVTVETRKRVPRSTTRTKPLSTTRPGDRLLAELSRHFLVDNLPPVQRHVCRGYRPVWRFSRCAGHSGCATLIIGFVADK